MIPHISPIIFGDLAKQYGIMATELVIGTPISINGGTGTYYIPLMYDGEVVHVVCVGETGDPNTPYAINYGRSFSDIFNSLPAGEYQLISNSENMFVVSQDVAVLAYGSGYDEEGQIEIPSFNDVDVSVQSLVSLSESSGVMRIPRTSRAVTSKELSVPFVKNDGLFGICWLAASSSITQSFGGSMSIDKAHAGVHPKHYIYTCEGGNIYEAQQVMLTYGNLSSTYAAKTTSGIVIGSISGNSPVYTHWFHYEDDGKIDSGHAMIISGFSYDNITNYITYTLIDSNKKDPQKVTVEANSDVWYFILEERYVLRNSLHSFQKVSYRLGDVNNRDGVEVTDILMILRHIAGKQLLQTDAQKLAADVNKDTKIDVNDILILLRFIAGKIQSF